MQHHMIGKYLVEIYVGGQSSSIKRIPLSVYYTCESTVCAEFAICIALIVSGCACRSHFTIAPPIVGVTSIYYLHV